MNLTIKFVLRTQITIGNVSATVGNHEGKSSLAHGK